MLQWHGQRGYNCKPAERTAERTAPTPTMADAKARAAAAREGLELVPASTAPPFMPCCRNRVHFESLTASGAAGACRWLRPDDAKDGAAAQRGKCPFGCKKTLSRSSRRMLTDGRRGRDA